MNIIEATKVCFQKYATFEGRARRAEFWWFTLVITVLSAIIGFIEGFVIGYFFWDTSFAEIFVSLGMGPLSGLLVLATFVPSLSVTSRRLHDIDRSAWWMLLMFVPILGWIVLIYWEIKKGTDGENRFGPDPLEA